MPTEMRPRSARRVFVFVVVAGGNSAAERHFEDTIKHNRTLDEVRRFLPIREAERRSAHNDFRSGRLFHVGKMCIGDRCAVSTCMLVSG